MPARRLSLSILAAMCLALFATAGSAQPAAAAAASGCRHEKAVGLPEWFTRGAWRNHQTMVVLDIPDQMPVEVSSSGVAIRRPGALAEHLHDLGSVAIRTGTLTPGARPQVLVQLASGGVVPLDREFAPRSAVEFAVDKRPASGDNKGGEGTIRTLHDWVLVQGEVIGYADIEGEDSNEGPNKSIFRWRNGFVRFRLGAPTEYQAFLEQTHPDPLRPYFRLAHPYLAGLGDTAYIIMMDGDMGLRKLGSEDQVLDDEKNKMKAFPEHLKGEDAPKFWDWAEREEFPRLMEEVERATMPTGLYAWDNALFIVSRSFERGRRAWYLSKIDPVRDKLLWTVPIKSDAHHLTVVPGPKEWAFFEKGPVTRPGSATKLFDQRTEQVLFVSSARMQAPKLKSLCN
ncbi:MAG TPA: hypothetical protein VN493_28685 [Thermoanaerobaculia bacterium]|nr:hypothetical protein [Thermoanaerobaculia bacterium]